MATFIFNIVSHGIGSMFSAIGKIATPILTKTSLIGNVFVSGVGKRLSAAPGSAVKTVRGSVTYIGGKATKTVPVTKTRRSSRSGTRTATDRGDAITSSIIGFGGRIWGFFQTIVWALFSLILLRNVGLLTRAVLFFFKPLSYFFYFLDTLLTETRETLADKRNLKYTPYKWKNKKRGAPEYPLFVGYTLIYGFLYLIELVLLVIQEFLLFISMLVQVLLNYCVNLSMRIWYIIVLFMIVAVSRFIQAYYVDMIDSTNSMIVTVENTAIQAAKVGNVTLDVFDAMAPIANEMFRNMVEEAEVLCDALCPEDMKMASNTRRRLFGRDRLIEKLSLRQYLGIRLRDLRSSSSSSPVKEPRVLEDFKERRGRNLQVTTNTPDTRSKRIIASGANLVRKLTLSLFLQNKVKIGILALVIAMLKPFIENIDSVSDPFAIFQAKLTCMTLGGLTCSAIEVVNHLVKLIVNFFNSFLPFQIPFDEFACSAGELENVDPALCGGRMNTNIPPGAFFSTLADEGANRRRLVNEQQQEEEQVKDRLVECKQHPLDGSWVEYIDGKMVHRSMVNKCPLSRHVFRDEFENVKQLNMLEVDHTDCYTVCLSGIKYESCYDKDVGHVRRFLGSCAPSTVEIKNESQARRHLLSLFPGSLFNWSSSSSDKKKPPPPKQQPVLVTPNVFINQGTDRYLYTGENPKPTTSEEIQFEFERFLNAKTIQNEAIFFVQGIQCKIPRIIDIVKSEALLVYMGCMIGKMIEERGISIGSIIKESMTSALPKKTTTGSSNRGRRLKDDANSKVEAIKSWSRDTTEKAQYVRETFKSLNRYIRLLSATSPEMPLSDRIDDLIDVASYRPMTRRMMLETEEVGFVTRGVQEIEIKDIGWCEGENMYPCPSTGDCVELDKRDECPDPAEDASVVRKVGHYIHQASLIDIDVSSIIDDTVQCYSDWRSDSSTVPSTSVNLLQGAGTFCAGSTPPFPYRFPPMEIHGINRFVSTGCHASSGQNNCRCAEYYRPATTSETFSIDYTIIDMRVYIVNSLTAIHWVFYQTLFRFMPWLQQGWENFLNWFSINTMPRWFVFIFSDLGIRRVSPFWGWVCFSIHLGDLMTLVLVWYLFYIFVISLDPFAYWASITSTRIALQVDKHIIRRQIRR